jgi:hypothetical protein
MTDPVVTAVKTEAQAVEASILSKIGAALAANPYKTLGLSGAAGGIIGFVLKTLL